MSSALRRLPHTAALRSHAALAPRQKFAPFSTRAVPADVRAGTLPRACALDPSPSSLHARYLTRGFRSTVIRLDDDKYAKKAKALSQKTLDEQEQQVRVRENQVKRPWHREGADEPPVQPDGEEGKGEEMESMGSNATSHASAGSAISLTRHG
jgi:hypothetical protein